MSLRSREVPPLRPVPVLYSEPKDKLEFPEFSHSSRSLFPLVSRKYFTNLLRSKFPKIHFVKAEIYYNASLLIPEQYEFPSRNHRDNSEIITNLELNGRPDLLDNENLTYRETGIPMKGYHFYQIHSQDLKNPEQRTPDAKNTDLISQAFPEGMIRSHPAWDPSQHWILDIKFFDENMHRIQNIPEGMQSLRLTCARFFKEYLKLYKSMEREAKMILEQIEIADKVEIFGKKVQGQASYPGVSYLRNHDQSIMLQEHKSTKSVLSRAVFADALWDLRKDDLQFSKIRNVNLGQTTQAENRPAAIHYTEIPLDFPEPHFTEQNPYDLTFLKVPRKIQQFYQALAYQLAERDEDTVLEIHLRQNYFLDPDSSHILESFCPVEELFQDTAEDDELTKIRVLRAVIFQPKGPAPKIGILEMDRYGLKSKRKWKSYQKREWQQDRSKQWLPVFGQEELSRPILELPQTREIAKTCKDFQKEIAELVRQDEICTAHQDPSDLKESLGNLENYVHPLVPVAWKERKLDTLFSEKRRIFLNSLGNFQNHWNSNRSRKEFWSDLQSGVKSGILRQQDRKKYALDILYNVAFTLQWPVDPDFYKRHKSKLWALIQEFHPVLEESLAKFVEFVGPDPEAARLASQDPNLDFDLCNAFLKEYPHCRSTMLRNPVMLQITSNAWNGNPSSTSQVFYNAKDMDHRYPMSNIELVRRTTNMSREKLAEFALLHALLPYSPRDRLREKNTDEIMQKIQQIPKANLQKIVAGLPVTRYRKPGMHFEVVDECAHQDRDHEPEVNSRNLGMHMDKLMLWLDDLAIEYIPENPFEWEILFRTHLRTIGGDPEKTRRQRITPNFYPALLKKIREQVASEEYTPDSLASWAHLHGDQHDKESLNALHMTIDHHINIGYETEEFMEVVSQNVDALERYLPHLYNSTDKANETIQEAQIALATLENLSSIKRIDDIHKKYSQHSPAIGQIDALAPHWPEKSSKPSYHWDKALLEPYVSSDGRYRIVEKNTAKELMKHGKEMSHCIGQYTPHCLREHKPLHVLSLWKIDQDRPCCTASISEKITITEQKKKISLIPDRLRKLNMNKSAEDPKASTIEKVYSNQFSQDSISGRHNNSPKKAEIRAVQEAIQKMEENTREGLYNIKLAMAQRKMTRSEYRKGQTSMKASQRAWAAVEKWKILCTIWSRLPELQEYPTDQQLLTLDGGDPNKKKSKRKTRDREDRFGFGQEDDDD